MDWVDKAISLGIYNEVRHGVSDARAAKVALMGVYGQVGHRVSDTGMGDSR